MLNIVILIISLLIKMNIYIPITHRNGMVYLRYLFPDKQNINYQSTFFNHKKILDIGCGHNIISKDSFIHKLLLHNRNVNVYGVDPYINSKNNIFSYLYNLVFPIPYDYSIINTHLIRYNAWDLPLSYNSVDIILSCWLLGTWIQTEKLLLKCFIEFHRVLIKFGEIRIYPICSLDSLNYQNLSIYIKNNFQYSEVYVSPSIKECIYNMTIPSYTWILKKL